MVLKIKNSEIINVKVSYIRKYRCIELIALNDNNKEIGLLRFRLNKDDRKIACLNHISVKEEYQHMGVASALIKLFEKISVMLGVGFIKGKYYPKNNYAKPFYTSNGYRIVYDEYDKLIFKALERDNVNEDFKNIIVSSAENELSFVNEIQKEL